jgi:hypothetical protein
LSKGQELLLHFWITVSVAASPVPSASCCVVPGSSPELAAVASSCVGGTVSVVVVVFLAVALFGVFLVGLLFFVCRGVVAFLGVFFFGLLFFGCLGAITCFGVFWFGLLFFFFCE